MKINKLALAMIGVIALALACEVFSLFVLYTTIKVFFLDWLFTAEIVDAMADVMAENGQESFAIMISAFGGIDIWGRAFLAYLFFMRVKPDFGIGSLLTVGRG